MNIVCPECSHKMSVKEAKPGKYAPSCSKCGKKFQLVVPAEAGAEPRVAKLAPAPAAVDVTMPAPGAGTGATLAPGVAETLPPPGAATIAPRGVEATLPPPAAPRTSGFDATMAPAGGGAAAPAAGVDATFAHRAQDATRAGATDGTMAHTAGGGGAPIEPAPDGELPRTLGGYQLVKELGRGGMGAVYLARQLSLDRNVAVKLMNPQWARDPAFVSRFTREAYAAAQMVHHNVVQIYDIGLERDTHFFSMEFVDGESLGSMLKREEKLDPQVAAGYILQAARGLKLAHDQGMIHRDIKPDNLMLNRHGVVKVADLGLVKGPRGDSAPATSAGGAAMTSGQKALQTMAADVTLANTAMGTPAYMAPEQAVNAAGVDRRADIYSLGCTFYALVTGRPVFEGKTAIEVMSKHKSEPVVPPEVVAARVPPTVSKVILKMVAKRPEDRYGTMEALIADLQEILGIDRGGTFSPREEHAQALESAVGRFHGAGATKLRSVCILAFYALCGLVFLSGLLFGSAFVAGAALGLAAMTTALYWILDGFVRKSFVSIKLREYLFGLRWADWGMAAAAAVLTLIVLWALGWLGLWIGLALGAALLAAAASFGLDAKVAAERKAPLADAEQLLKSMRLKGLEEDALRQFVCRYSGKRWEEFYEALFGYENKLKARLAWGRGDDGQERPRFASWREPLVRWFDAQLVAIKEARERRLLERIEAKKLEAAGTSAAEATRLAQEAAAAMMTDAAATRAKVSKSKEKPRVYRAEPRSSAASDWLVLLFGARMRFLAAALLLTGFFLWAKQNGILGKLPDQASLQAAAQGLTDGGPAPTSDQVREQGAAALEEAKKLIAGTTTPLKLPAVPDSIAAGLGGWAAGVGGLCLLFLALFRGPRMSLFALPLLLLVVFGRGFLPAGLVGEGIASAAAGGLAVAGFLFGRSRD